MRINHNHVGYYKISMREKMEHGGKKGEGDAPNSN